MGRCHWEMHLCQGPFRQPILNSFKMKKLIKLSAKVLGLILFQVSFCWVLFRDNRGSFEGALFA